MLIQNILLTQYPIGCIIGTLIRVFCPVLLPEENFTMNSKITVGVFVLAIATGIFVMSVGKSYAKISCTTQYGGGETCVNVTEDAKLSVDKTIYNPKSGQYEDHVKSTGGSNPYVFGYNETIKFKITVKNTGDVKIKDINMYDALPTFLKYKSGDGDDRKDGKEVKFEVGDLEPGEEESYIFRAEIENGGISPNSDKICLTNMATAKGEREDNQKDEESVDYSNFCITLGKVLGSSKEKITKLPTTGSEDFLIPAVSVGLILIGFGIRKLVD